MNKEKKISVRTPASIYIQLLQRAYELDLTHREYYLALAIQDLEKKELNAETAAKLKQEIKDLDIKYKK